MNKRNHSPPREEAERAFAREINDATQTVSETDDASVPPSVLLPTGATTRAVFVVGPLVDVTTPGTEGDYVRGRLVNPTGMLYLQAGRFQPAVARMLGEIDLPVMVRAVGTPRTARDSADTETVFLHPDHLTLVDERVQSRWLSETARVTLERIEAFEAAANEHVALAREHYGADVERYREAVRTAKDVIDGRETSVPRDASTE